MSDLDLNLDNQNAGTSATLEPPKEKVKVDPKLLKHPWWKGSAAYERAHATFTAALEEGKSIEEATTAAHGVLVGVGSPGAADIEGFAFISEAEFKEVGDLTIEECASELERLKDTHAEARAVATEIHELSVARQEYEQNYIRVRSSLQSRKEKAEKLADIQTQRVFAIRKHVANLQQAEAAAANGP